MIATMTTQTQTRLERLQAIYRMATDECSKFRQAAKDFGGTSRKAQIHFANWKMFRQMYERAAAKKD